MSKEEGALDFRQPAQVLHNKVRAFAGWPGTSASFVAHNEEGGRSEIIDVKIISTAVADPSGPAPPSGQEAREVAFVDGRMLIECGGGRFLEVFQLQPRAKKVLTAKEFKNGLGRKKLFYMPTSTPAAAPVAASQ